MWRPRRRRRRRGPSPGAEWRERVTICNDTTSSLPGIRGRRQAQQGDDNKRGCTSPRYYRADRGLRVRVLRVVARPLEEATNGGQQQTTGKASPIVHARLRRQGGQAREGRGWLARRSAQPRAQRGRAGCAFSSQRWRALRSRVAWCDCRCKASAGTGGKAAQGKAVRKECALQNAPFAIGRLNFSAISETCCNSFLPSFLSFLFAAELLL